MTSDRAAQPAESAAGAEEQKKARIRPRDAATLVLIDRSGPVWRLLVGKRSVKHVFMPETYVFPGGRRDRRDHALPFETDIHPAVLEKLIGEKGSRLKAARARALALAAVRELQEETGLILGNDAGSGGCIALLHHLRYVARAITPPGMVRRFDTRFFAAFADEAGLDPQAIRDSNELHDLRWVPINATAEIRMPEITRLIVKDLLNLMDNDPALSYGKTVPFYHERKRIFLRELF